MVRRITLACTLSLSVAAVAQDSPLLDQTIKSGAFAESIVTFCSQKNARGAQQYSAALAAWKQRNHWDNILPKARPGQYDEAAATATQSIRKQGMKALVLCMDMRSTLATAAFDPSQQHAQELAELAGESAAPPAPSVAAEAQTVAPPPIDSPPQPVAPAAVPAGSTGQLGDASFTLPATWRAGKATATEALFQRPAKDRGEVNLFVLSQKPLQGDFKSAFASVIRSNFPGKTPELQYIYPAKTRTGLPALYVRDGSQMQRPGTRGKSAEIRAVGVQLPNHQIFVVMLISTDGYTGKDAAEDDLTALVSSLSFRSQNSARPWNPLVDHGRGNASGVYWYSTVNNVLNPFGGMDLRAEQKYVVLLPGGRAFKDLPKGGHVLDMDFNTVCQDPKQRENCGSYDLNGSTMTFRWPEDFGLMSETSGPYLAGKSVTSQEQQYNYVAPVNGDLKLTGRYRSFFASVGSSASGSTAVSSEKFITFSPDGRYQKQGFTGASFSNSNASGAMSGKKAPTYGSYKINGYTLTLQPSAGPQETYTVIFEKQSTHPDAVWIDDEGYLAK